VTGMLARRKCGPFLSVGLFLDF